MHRHSLLLRLGSSYVEGSLAYVHLFSLFTMPKTDKRGSDSGDPGAIVIKFRLDHGLCYLCGAQVYDTTSKNGRRRLVARDVPGIASAGRCLHCYPDFPAPASGPPQSVSATDELSSAGGVALDPPTPTPRPLPAAVATPSPTQTAKSAGAVERATDRQRQDSVAPSEGCAGDDEVSSSLGLSSFDSGDDEAAGGKEPKAVPGPVRVRSSSDVTDEGDEEFIVVDSKGNAFIGTFVEGTIDEGRGKFRHMHSDGEFEGKSSTYEGQIRNGKFHGRGVRMRANGEVHEGEFRNGAADGHGKWVSGDGEWVFEGDFKKDKKHGCGTCRQAEPGGEVYEGEFKNDMWHGKGRLQFHGGGEYDGEFKRDAFSGKGRYSFADGSLYEGSFKNDHRDGVGTMTYSADNLKYEGNWKNNWRHGQGKLSYADGSVFTGVFREDKKDGKGVLTLPDGTHKQEHWVKGALKGTERMD